MKSRSSTACQTVFFAGASARGMPAWWSTAASINLNRPSARMTIANDEYWPQAGWFEAGPSISWGQILWHLPDSSPDLIRILQKMACFDQILFGNASLAYAWWTPVSLMLLVRFSKLENPKLGSPHGQLWDLVTFQIPTPVDNFGIWLDLDPQGHLLNLVRL